MTRCLGPYLATERFLPIIKQSHHAKVTNISSDFRCLTSKGSLLFPRCPWHTCKVLLVRKAHRLILITIDNDHGKGGAKPTNQDYRPSFQGRKRQNCSNNAESSNIATKLTGWEGEDDMDTSVKGMVDIIERVKHADSGLFFDHPGGKLAF